MKYKHLRWYKWLRTHLRLAILYFWHNALHKNKPYESNFSTKFHFHYGIIKKKSWSFSRLFLRIFESTYREIIWADSGWTKASVTGRFYWNVHSSFLRGGQFDDAVAGWGGERGGERIRVLWPMRKISNPPPPSPLPPRHFFMFRARLSLLRNHHYRLDGGVQLG